MSSAISYNYVEIPNSNLVRYETHLYRTACLALVIDVLYMPVSSNIFQP